MENLYKINLSAYESRILWFIFRKTYGWHKKEDRISYTQFEETGIDRRNIGRTLKDLKGRNLITISGNGQHLIYGFQKDYSRWLPLSNQTTVDTPLSEETIAPLSNQTTKPLSKETMVSKSNHSLKLSSLLSNQTTKPLSKETNTKETKETKQKKSNTISDVFDIFWKTYPKKVGKLEARIAFVKINPDADLLATMLASIEKAVKTELWQKEGGKYILDPARWLKGRRWEDEIKEEPHGRIVGNRVPETYHTPEGETWSPS